MEFFTLIVVVVFCWVSKLLAASRAGSTAQETTASSDPKCENSVHGSRSGSNAELLAVFPSNDNHDQMQPAIFLSHSGMQKPFVERLYSDLGRANRSAFFDQHTLPRGTRFPPNIERAALDCRLGVVVLSEDFLTSKWPMLELEMLVLQRGPDPKVLPLFYRLQATDLKSTENLSRWRRVWQKLAGPNADKWEEAVRKLRAFNGETYKDGTSEADYLKRVLRTICNQVPSPPSYDLSYVQGQPRLAQEVADQFEHARLQDATVCSMIGLHGLGGLGKTTLCKIMVNFYSPQYPGRSHLLEFPTDSDNMTAAVREGLIREECKRALVKLTDLSNEYLVNDAVSLDQVTKLMRVHLPRHDVFLAIDNVWENSQETLEKILGVGFSANSKILVTSRSEQLLRDLLKGHRAPEREEASQIFRDALFQTGDRLNSRVRRDLLDIALARCRFHGTYNALALKALGKRMKRLCSLEDSDHCLSLVLKEISCSGGSAEKI